MRRAWFVVGLVLVAACSSSHPVASTTTTSSVPPSTTPPAAGTTTTTTSTTLPPQPTLGSAAALEVDISGADFGEVRPAEVSLGGDPTGIVSQISWQSWGGSQATGTGTTDYVANGQIVAAGTEEPAQIVAFNLGTCEGLYMYQEVEWFFPQHGQTFDPARGMDACDPAAPGLEHPKSGVGFFSPTHNVSCQILDGPPYPDTKVYCQTGSPAASVTLAPDGTYQPCQGTSCLGNPAVNTPVLAYSHTVTLGPFRCDSETDGMTCTASGKGFRISRTGIVPIG